MGTNNYIKTIWDKKEVTWQDVKPGDKVYVAGNLEDGEPTCTYGPHRVVDPVQRKLVNGKGREFYERWDFLYVEK